MVFKFDQIVPWGRSLKEYSKFFNLSENDLNKKIISVGDGPCSFNSEITKMGKYCVSFDPIYKFTKQQIQNRIDETYKLVQQETIENFNNFIWKEYKNPEELFKIRLSSMAIFLEDFEKGKMENRYITGELPHLPFQNNEFDLAICSHFLFLYTEQFSLENHIKSIIEILRVANEFRIFPILDFDAKKSEHLNPVISEMKGKGFDCSIEKVNYEFQKGGNEMLKILKT